MTVPSGTVRSSCWLTACCVVGIERLPSGVDDADARLAQNADDLRVHGGHASDQMLDLVIRRGVLDRALEVVDCGKQLLDEALGGALALVLALASDALAEVVELGLRAQHLVAQLGGLGDRRLQRALDDVTTKLELGPKIVDELRVDASEGPA